MKTKKMNTRQLKQEVREKLAVVIEKSAKLEPGSYEHQRAMEDVKTLTEALKELEKEEMKKETLRDITQIVVTLAVIGFELKHIFTGKSFTLIPKR